MTPNEVLASLVDSGTIDELNGLLWVGSERHRGLEDPGWHCQEHAVLLGGLLALRGVECKVGQGRCVFVQRPDDDETRDVFGQLPEDQILGRFGHTWLEVDGVGTVDFSPNLNVTDNSAWRDLRSNGVVGETWDAPGLRTTVTTCSKLSDYRKAYESAAITCQPGTASVVYYHQHTERLREELFTRKFLGGSSFTSQAFREGGRNVFLKLVGQLASFSAGQAESLRSENLSRVWRLVKGRSDAEVDALRDALGEAEGVSRD